MKHGKLGTAYLSLLLGAVPTSHVAAQDATTAPPNHYICANGTTLDVAHFVVRGHKAVEIGFPTGRNPGDRTKRLLPATQTGSGERYASDITEFHMKGNIAHFRTDASAQSEAISRIECNRAVAEKDAKPVTQPARAGRYFVLHPNGPVYNRIETACFADDGMHYFGVSPTGKPGQVLTFNGKGVKNAEVSPVDAGVGQRRFTLTKIEDTNEQITLHFIAPGMRETELPSATSGLNSITAKDNRIDCVDGDGIVYMGTNGKRGVVVSLEDEGLSFRSYGNDQDIAWPKMNRGYIAHNDDSTVFEFLDGENRVRIETNRNGFLVQDSWALDTPVAKRSEVPEAFFVANRSVFPANLPSLDKATLKLLSMLSFCNHLAGESGEDAGRNTDIKEKWDEATCEILPKAYARAMKSAEAGSPLRTYLKRNSPNWM